MQAPGLIEIVFVTEMIINVWLVVHGHLLLCSVAALYHPQSDVVFIPKLRGKSPTPLKNMFTNTFLLLGLNMNQAEIKVKYKLSNESCYVAGQRPSKELIQIWKFAISLLTTFKHWNSARNLLFEQTSCSIVFRAISQHSYCEENFFILHPCHKDYEYFRFVEALQMATYWLLLKLLVFSLLLNSVFKVLITVPFSFS